jgi:hypothetical protein
MGAHFLRADSDSASIRSILRLSVKEGFQSQRLSPRPRVSSAIRHQHFLTEAPPGGVFGYLVFSFLALSESLAQLVLAVAQVVDPQVSLSETIKVIVSTVFSAQKLARVTLCTGKNR